MEECHSQRLDDAIAFALDAFRHTVRKGTRVPYMTHLLSVMCVVGEYGGDEDQMIAAVLHDWLEDIEGADEALLTERWGPRVALLVRGLTDATTRPKPPWKARKLDYLAHLRGAPHELKLVSAADKLHNCQCIRRDLGLVGAAVWSRFSAGRDETLWYYDAVTDALGDGWSHPLHARLVAEVGLLRGEA